MQLWLRLTVLGVCVAAGISLAVAMALPFGAGETARAAGGSDAASPASQSSGEADRDTGPREQATTPRDDAKSQTGEVPRAESGPALPSASPALAAPGAAQPPASALPTYQVVQRLDRSETQDMLDAAFQRWTATYWPPVTAQFEQLEDQAKKVTAKIEEAKELVELLKQQERAVPPAPPPRADLPLLNSPAPQESPRGQANPPEVALSSGRDFVSVNAMGSDVREVLKALSEAAGLNILATPNVTGTISLSLTDVEVETALHAILKSTGYSSRREGPFLFVGTVDELQKMAVAGDHVGTRIYRPNYVSAAELQKLITSLLTPQIGTCTISSPPEVGIISDKNQVGGDSFAGADVLLVRDFESILRKIDEVYHEVDQMPSQVVIEAMILSVRLDDENTIGVDFELLRNKDNIRIVSGMPAAGIASIDFSEGLKVGFLDESLAAFLEALETIGDTNVVATPRVMCLNKQRAEILIGSELGYISTTVTETAATQSVEFLEVGTHLKIRPFISEDGMVRLEVHPELSTGAVRVQSGFTLPDKDVTQVTTNVMCRSGATVVIGGLIREDLVANAQQIPVLGNLPLVGALFRQRTENTERREIIVLLTPRIVDELSMLAEGQKALTESRDRRNAFYDKMQPTNKRRIGERYGRLALSAWTAGDASSALRYANLAIHYDPLHQDAINLRQQILATYPCFEPHTRSHLRYGLAPWQHPVHDYSAAAGWPWRPVGPEPRDMTLPARDPGHSGPIRTLITDAP